MMKKFNVKCIYCKNTFVVYKLSEAKRRKFCNTSCAASYNNPRKPRRSKKRPCTVCGYVFFPPTNHLNRVRCNNCYNNNKYPRKTNRPKYLNYTSPDIDFMTKGELFTARKSWQSARSAITKHAIVTYRTSQKPQKCCICGYSKHFHVCHKKAVSDFLDSVLIKDINALYNLRALCPNHHWEFDNGLLKL